MKSQNVFNTYLRILTLAGFACIAGCSNPSGVDHPAPPINTIPIWDTQPIVAASSGGFTLTAGNVSGNPAPTTGYYHAADGTGLPSDNGFASDPNWTEVTAGLPTIVSAGIYDSYGVAVNSEGTTLSNRIDFTIPSPSAGDQQIFAAGELNFSLQYCTGAAANIMPTGADDSGLHGLPISAFWMAETEVSYEVWTTVVSWATGNGYSFANAGIQGDGVGDTDEHPVSMVNWRDAMLFGNALTEWYNANNGNQADLNCVYYIDAAFTTPIRQVNDSETPEVSAGAQDNPYINSGANGFRLPDMYEWECAARYIDGINWSPGNYASGALADYTNAAECERVAVYGGTSSAAAVKSKDPNALGCYDMSGNMWEWNFTEAPLWDGRNRYTRGGSWDKAASTLQLGQTQYTTAYSELARQGFRLCRNP